MNIEQLERGNRILAQISTLKGNKEDLANNYAEHTGNYQADKGFGLSISFREKECRSVVTFKLSNEELKETYDLLNSFLERKIRAAQKEFDEL